MVYGYLFIIIIESSCTVTVVFDHTTNRYVQPQVKSVLDDIPGVGPARRKALMRHFGSLDEIRQADIDQLCEIPEINRRCGQEIYNFFHEKN